MTAGELKQYLRDVSEFIGLDPDLNGLDAIWMPNESGTGQSLAVYARRGTAEILRNKLGVDVDELADHMVSGSIVFIAKGHNKDGRKEQAVGSKSIKGLEGKLLDDAIMTASTRALRRLTMQFTTLGILDESEVNAVKGETITPPNPAGAATLAANPLPPVFAQPTVQPNNAPGKPVEMIGPSEKAAVAGVFIDPQLKGLEGEPFVGQQNQIDEAMAQVAKKAESKVDLTIHDLTKPEAAKVEAAAVAIVAPEATAPASRPKRTRKPKNTVSLDVEPETVSVKAAVSAVVETPVPVEATPASVPAPEANLPAPQQANLAAPVQADVAPVAGMPSKEQMGLYRQKVGVYTSQLPASQDLGSVQKMRAFITKQVGATPQDMTVEQWSEMLSWFESFVERNQIKGLVKYINDSLGVK
jgi:hypothetical protein